jgi:hypothetical protein
MVRDGVLTGPPLEEPLTWLTRQPLEPTPARLRGEARVEKVLGASSPTFLVKGRAGGRGTLFAGAFGRGTPFGTEGVALRDEDVTRCLQSEACHFVLDGGGEARVVLPSDLAAALPAGAVATALVYGRELPTPSIAVAPYVDAATGASREPPGSRAAPR